MTQKLPTEDKVKEDLYVEGFLSPLLDQFREKLISNNKIYFDYAVRLNRFAMRCWVADPDNLDGKTMHSHYSIVARLMARAMGAYQGAIKLLECGMRIEAANLVRSIYEAAFWMNYFVVSPDEATKYFEQDELKAKESRLKTYQKIFHNQPSRLSKINTALEDAEAQRMGRKHTLQIEDLADKAGLKNIFPLYKYLCGAASHASIRSTDEYIVRESAEEAYHLFGPDWDAMYRIFADLMTSFQHCIKAYVSSAGNESAHAEFDQLVDEFVRIAGRNPVNPLG